MEKTYVIAEMACSHEGDPELARKIIDGAGMAGADAVQFQIWSLRDMVVPQHPDYGKLQKIELSRSAWRDLAAYARGRYPELHIIACVYERSSIDFAEDIRVDAYKIHSSDLSNPYLLKYAAQTGRDGCAAYGSPETMKRIRNYIPVLIPLIVSAIRRSLELAEAMESRAWGACKKRTNLYALKLHRGDYILLALIIVILVAASYFFVFVSIPTVASFFGL